MIAILCGSDGVGKTTIFRMLEADVRRATFISEKYPGPDDLPRLLRWELLQRLTEHSRKLVAVYDRATALDDLIYEPIIANRPSIFANNQAVRDVLAKCAIVYLYADPTVLDKRLRERGDLYIKPGTSAKIQASYESLFQQWSLPVIRIDTTGKTAEQVYEKVFQFIGGLM